MDRRRSLLRCILGLIAVGWAVGWSSPSARAEAQSSDPNYHIMSSDYGAEDAIYWLDHVCAASRGNHERIRNIMTEVGARQLADSELADQDLPHGVIAWAFATHPELGLHFLLVDTPSRICAVRVNLAKARAMQQAVRDLLDTWDACCKTQHRTLDERDRLVPGQTYTAHFVVYLVEQADAPTRYAIALTTIDNPHTPWQAFISFSPTSQPFE